MGAGRPTKYTKELLEKAHEYLESWNTLGDQTPQIVGLALHCGINLDTVYEWEKHEDKLEFSEIVSAVRMKQHQNLVNGGLSNTFNANITKLLLSKHGYSDKQEVDVKSTDGSMSPAASQEALDDRLRELGIDC